MKRKSAAWPAVLVDTREQRPWTFDGDICRTFEVSITTSRGTLDTGDYALADAPEIARIERKSLGDFVSSVTHEHDRFMREMERLASYPVACVMVEAELGEVVSRTREARPQSVVCSALKVCTDYRVPVIWGVSRPWAEWQAAWMLRRAWEKRALERSWLDRLVERTATLFAEALDWSA